MSGNHPKAKFLAQMYLLATAFAVVTALAVQGSLESDGDGLLFWIPATAFMAAVTLLLGYLAVMGTVRWKRFRDDGDRSTEEEPQTAAETERLAGTSRNEPQKLRSARRVMWTALALWVVAAVAGPAFDLSGTWWIVVQAVAVLVLLVSFVIWSTLWARQRGRSR